MEKVKGYKVFNYDWTCRGFQYEIGKEYKFDGEIKVCEKGFHFCEKLEDCFSNYPAVSWNKIAEVEGWGEIQKHNSDSKVCCNRIKIIEEISWDEISNYISGGNNISGGNDISGGYNISGGNNIWGGNNIRGGNDIWGGNDISGGNDIWGGNYIRGGNHIRGGNDIWGGNNIWGGNYIRGGNDISGGNYIRDGNYIRGGNDIWGCYKCEGISRCMFCCNYTGKLALFNKRVSEERFREAANKYGDLIGDWDSTFNNLKSLYLKCGSDWTKTPIPLADKISKEEAWADMPEKAIGYLKSLPEFDADIFFEITGKR